MKDLHFKEPIYSLVYESFPKEMTKELGGPHRS